ncbi:TIGR01244 family sulfur transferase [Amaricoccus sp.]|uniref:TIGR01244 family sulfur transferase n=1 Tax=Amaricoccus sp. TaxID=1872485 RepID=UPI001B511043|nr:TIGR01244 family sulfur transferase [Amaricoccus sp.]MBP7241283.1 TIGR01244 family phosphatase [Amaricoccus sp.]
MTATRIAPDFAASPQITPEDVAEIAALGYRSLMCNRPDGEEPGQAPFARISAAAQAAGLAVAHVPVVSGRITAADVEAFRTALAELPAPVFAYCRSGGRCQNLWSLSR